MENKKTAQNDEHSKAPTELENEALDQVAGGIFSLSLPVDDSVPVP